MPSRIRIDDPIALIFTVNCGEDVIQLAQ
jgi:hypothetical protein